MKKLIQTLLVFMILMSSTYAGLAQPTQMSVRRIVHAGPPLQTLASASTTHCAGTPGPNVFLTSSTTTTSYQLWRIGFPNITVGTPVTGLGSIVNFGPQNDGTYFVIATSLVSPFCSDTMLNSVTISSMAIPAVNITASGPTTGCGPVVVTLSTPYELGCTYQWQDNMVNILGATSTSYTATVNNTTKVFTCVATNSLGCTFNQSVVVTSHPVPQAFVVSTTTPTFCEGTTGSVILQSSLTGVNYQLMSLGSPVGVPVLGTGLVLSWSGLTGGTYTVVATDNTTLCTATMTGSATLVESPLPLAAGTIIGSTTVCQNATIPYSTSNIVNATSYVWSVPTGATITSGQGTTMIQVDFTGASSGIISVRGHNSCGDGQSTPISVTVNQAPSLNITANPTDVCAGTSTDLTANGTGTIFAWSGGGSTQTITVWPTTNTTYSVTVTGPNGCSATGNIAINVHTAPAVALVLTDDNFCTDVNSAVISGGSPAGGTYTGTCVFGGNTIYPPVSGAGTWVITYTYADGYGCSGSATDLLTINPIPIVMFTNIVGVIYSDTPPFDLMGNVSPIGGTFTGDGMVGSMFSPAIAGPGNHILTYTYVHPFTGCSASQIQYVNVGTVGIDEVSVAANAISIFPNPATTMLNLNGIDTKQIKSLNIINLLGEVVYTTTINAENMVLDVSSLATGSYFIRFIDADGISISKKIMKNE